MAYCYECGSEVAEIDIFCPYCGISLKPVAAVGDDSSMDKTVVMNNDDDSFVVPVGTPPNIIENQKIEFPSESLPEIEDVDDKAVTLTDEAASKTEENFDLKTEEVITEKTFEEPNFPPALKTEEETQANIEEKDENELPEPAHIEILKPLETESENEILSLATDVEEITETPSENFDAKSSESTIESISESFEKNDLISQFDNPLRDEEQKSEPKIELSNEMTQESAAEEFRPENMENQSAEMNQDQVLTMIHPSQQLENILEDRESEKADAVETESPASFVPEAIEEKNETDLKPIFKPETELQESEKPQPESVFDSVQIVQTEQKEEDLEKKIAEIESKNLAHQQEVSETKVEEKIEAADESKTETEEEKENRSYTTPNIAAGQTDGKKAAKLKPLDEGTILNNRYEIIRKIGGGGMGAVYLASDKNLGGILRAVKEMVQSYIEETQQDKAIADFKRESTLLTSLEHPAIPTIFDYFFDEKEARFYLVMKYISGGDLAGRLRASSEGKIDEKTVTEWAIQIADVLDYLHKHDPPIVYRDLKPANVMIDGNSGRLMLIDFGIARWINKEEKGVTAVGTMGYAPPELFSGNVEPRSDIYSLGSTMFHLLTGADPQSNPLLIFDFQKNPRPRQINSALSDQMERILMQAVEYNAEKRFESAAVLKKTLEEHLENLKSGRVTYGVKEIPASAPLSDQLVFCGFCGQKIIASDVFCAFCGSQQPSARQSVQTPVFAAQFGTAKLVLENIEDFEKPTFSLEKESNIVGRRDPMSNIFPEVDLSKFDPQTKISRRHARIWREGNNFLVEDLGSSNGTILQPVLSEMVRLLPHQPHVLTNGDKLKIGDTTMSFTIG